MRKLLFIISLVATLTCYSAEKSLLLGSWLGKLQLGVASLTLQLNLDEKEGAFIATLDSPDQNAKGIPANVDYCENDSVSVSVPLIKASYRGKRNGKTLDGTFSQNGYNFQLILTYVDEVDLSQLRPQEPKAPFPYTTKEVTFINEKENVTLAGTLTYPLGYKNGDNVPVVLMVSGSGLQDRNEEIFGHKPFLVIADALARNGIATLRYDDRTVGKSVGGDAKNATTMNFLQDAEAGIDFLKSMKQFKSVGVLGHSEGGNIAIMLAARNKVDFGISMAGIGVKGDTALTAQANKINELNGAQVRYSMQTYCQYARSMGNPWLSFFLDYDPTADIKACKCPMLCLNGEKDCQVIAELNLTTIKKMLPPNKLSLCKSYPELNHLFQSCKTGNPTEYGAITETISPDVLSDITTWIKKL